MKWTASYLSSRDMEPFAFPILPQINSPHADYDIPTIYQVVGEVLKDLSFMQSGEAAQKSKALSRLAYAIFETYRLSDAVPRTSLPRGRTKFELDEAEFNKILARYEVEPLDILNAITVPYRFLEKVQEQLKDAPALDKLLDMYVNETNSTILKDNQHDFELVSLVENNAADLKRAMEHVKIEHAKAREREKDSNYLKRS
jgi:hypothetical protein